MDINLYESGLDHDLNHQQNLINIVLYTMHRAYIFQHFTYENLSVAHGQAEMNEYSERNCNDFECVRKPTESRLSLTHRRTNKQTKRRNNKPALTRVIRW